MRLFIFFMLLTVVSCRSENNGAGSTQNVSRELVEEIEHYENGVIKTKGNTKNGKREGLWISNFVDGKRWSESYYKEGLLHGTTLVFYPNGSMFYKGKFRENKRVGNWTFYKEDGKVDYETNYEN
ncbi:MAG: hypothetical protein HKN39_07790 [Flavobacteriales bacterium]|nr:hypothetical protein [Flavobacteriales bacterium]